MITKEVIEKAIGRIKTNRDADGKPVGTSEQLEFINNVIKDETLIRHAAILSATNIKAFLTNDSNSAMATMTAAFFVGYAIAKEEQLADTDKLAKDIAEVVNA